MQLYLSMRIRSFAVPICISLVTCILGVGLYAMHAGNVFPTSNLILGMDATDAANIPLGSAIVIIAVNLIYTALFCGLAVHYLKKKGVNAIKIEESSWKRKNDNC